jgi:hypothetical protein
VVAAGSLAVLGGGIVWSFALHPWRMRRHILATTPATQSQALEFNDTGIEIDAEGVGRRRADDLR